MRRHFKIMGALVILLLLVALFVWRSRRSEREREEEGVISASSHISVKDGERRISLDSASQTIMGLKVDSPQAVLGKIFVPSSAIVWWDGKAWVYLQKNTEQFIRREVELEAPDQVMGKTTEEVGERVTKGLSGRDPVVVIGAQLLLSEEFRSQIQDTEVH